MFQNLSDSKTIYSMQEIEEWLNENWEKYRDTIDEWECKDCPTDIGLPCICAEPDEEWKFFKLYEALDILLKRHRKEKYFEQQMREYDSILFSEIDLKIWTAKNEELGLEDFSTFEYDYLDYKCKNNETKHLRVAESDFIIGLANALRKNLGKKTLKLKPDYEVYINRNDFKYTLEFIDTFNELFWNREILPESLERIDNEMKQHE